MNCGLIQLFALLDSIPEHGAPGKSTVSAAVRFKAGELFAEDIPEKLPDNTKAKSAVLCMAAKTAFVDAALVKTSEEIALEEAAQADFAVIAGIYSSGGLPSMIHLAPAACLMYELSLTAFSAFVHAWMSELPIETETIRFGRKILDAAKWDSANWTAAERAAADHGDPDVRLVLDTAYKVWLEVDRLRGLLRFNPDEQGQYIAGCSPDYFVLPALGEHFTLRFGDTPWSVIDEKRGLCLRRPVGQPPAIYSLGQSAYPDFDEWEQLWRHYHRTINNESRNNPALQRRFMPKRYWKNLPEMR
jgi:probable DNA metabolism protein